MNPGGSSGTAGAARCGSDAAARTRARASADPGGAPPPRERPGARAPRARRAPAPRRRTPPRTTSSATRTAPRRRLLGRAAERRGDRVRVAERTLPAAAHPRAGSGRAAGSTPGAATTSTSSRLPSVSVPVLSRQTVSTDASDSIAFSCWASAPVRASRTAPAANVTEASSTSPSGTSEIRPAVAVCAASRNAVRGTKRRDQDRRQRHHHGQQQPQQPVDLQLERRQLAPRRRAPRASASLANESSPTAATR